MHPNTAENLSVSLASDLMQNGPRDSSQLKGVERKRGRQPSGPDR
jgi:hypothetical protein